MCIVLEKSLAQAVKMAVSYFSVALIVVALFIARGGKQRCEFRAVDKVLGSRTMSKQPSYFAPKSFVFAQVQPGSPRSSTELAPLSRGQTRVS